ncbi:hypothetical protein ACS0TY_017970 [Phlomoides rotata]
MMQYYVLWERRELRVIKAILRNFELISGLKVNFNKCSISGTNIFVEMLQNWAAIVGCSVMTIPFFYLD